MYRGWPVNNATNTTAIEVADSALDFLRYGQERGKWLAALMKAIQLDAQHNQGLGSNDLACLGRYLSSDTANYLDDQTEQLQRQLNATGGDQ